MRGTLVAIAAALAAAVSSVAAAAAPQAAGEVQVRIEREEGVRAVKRLQNALSQYLEEGRWSELAPLFTADATGVFPGERVDGRQALVRHFMTEAGRKGEGLADGQLNEHLILQPIVNLGPDGRSAKATWHEVAMNGRYGGEAQWSGGIWENDYALDRDGVWRISGLHFYRQYRGGYDEPGFKAPARWDIPYHFQAAHVGLTIPASALTPDDEAAASTADLEARARRLDDETRLSNLQHAFGYYLDRKLWDDAADLFADQGMLEIGKQGGNVGREQIRKALEATYGGPGLKRGELFDHVLLGTVVAISPDGSKATARSTSLGMIGQNGQGAHWDLGTIETSFVRSARGWSISALRYAPRMAADYDKGWAKDGGSSPWPKVQRVPISFPNPGGRAPRMRAPDPGDNFAAGRLADRAIAVDAVENLNSAYGYYIDESDWDGMSDMYAAGGSKEITGVGVYVGPERIRKVLKLRGPLGGRTANFYTIHQLTQPVIDVDGGGRSAKARLRLFQMGGDADGSTGAWIGGIYENTATLENGEWKFGVQDLHHLYNASYRGGWARVGEARAPGVAPPPTTPGVRPVGGGLRQGLGGARSPGQFAADFPPDRPIRVQRQYAFPDIVEPAFHYRNPVSGRMPAELLP
jgi:hypothetical protein